MTRELAAQCVRQLRSESIPRLRRCLDLLDEEAVWRAPAPSVPSVGNLLLHLEGNVRQWILSGLGGVEDLRDRDAEFESVEHPTGEEALVNLTRTVNAACSVLEELDPEDWLRTHAVQIYEETGVGIAIHVVEHFSYHVGQISYWTKILLGVDLGYYEGQDLSGRPDA